MGRWQDISLFD